MNGGFRDKQLVNPDDVEVVFQKTSIVPWKKMAEFNPAGSFFHWQALLAYDGFENLAGRMQRDRSGFGWSGGWQSGRRGHGQLGELKIGTSWASVTSATTNAP